MNFSQALAAAQNHLQSGNARRAGELFLEIWRNRRATFGERRQALKGWCNSLDARGQYYTAETEFEDGDRILRREIARYHQEQERAARAAQTTRMLMWGAAGVAVAGIFSSLLSGGSRHAEMCAA